MFDSVRYYIRAKFRAFGLGWLFDLDWWLSWVPFWLSPRFFGLILTYPFRWMASAWHERRLRHLLWGLPSLLMLVVMACVFHMLRLQASSISYVYWTKAQESILRKEYPVAEILLDRILREQTAHIRDAKYGLAVVYSETGREDRAESLFLELAPDKERGHPDAHQHIARLLAEVIKPSSNSEERLRLLWHLQNASDQDSAEMSLAWGRYAIVIEDLNGARNYLEKAAVKFPELWMTIGEVNVQLGNNEAARDSFEKATLFLAAKLKDASGIDRRVAGVDYATVLMRLGRLDEARVVLEEGLQKDPEGEWRTLLAALYVNYHDLLSLQGGHEIGELLVPISKALEYEANYGPALNRLMAYVSAKVEGNVELRKVLARVVAEGKEPALAHLALGNLYWIEGDTTKAVFHFERAIKINDKLVTVMNNLAWILATAEENPDLDRALGLIDAALVNRPDDPDFHDTRGTVLMKLGRQKEALNDLEKAISLRIKNPGPVHGKLAALYEELGMAEMSEQNRLLEQNYQSGAGPSEKGVAEPLSN